MKYIKKIQTYKNNSKHKFRIGSFSLKHFYHIFISLAKTLLTSGIILIKMLLTYFALTKCIPTLNRMKQWLQILSAVANAYFSHRFIFDYRMYICTFNEISHVQKLYKQTSHSSFIDKRKKCKYILIFLFRFPINHLKYFIIHWGLERIVCFFFLNEA